jgi:hypothetical protein
MLWDPTKHTDEENLRWCWLRAIEWGRWPLFASQTIAPLLLAVYPWFYVVGGFFIANILWAFIRYRFISIGLANAIADFMIWKWPITIGAVILLARQQNWPIVILVLLWPVVSGVLGIVTPTQIGKIQNVMMEQLGYERVGVGFSKEGKV